MTERSDQDLPWFLGPALLVAGVVAVVWGIGNPDMAAVALLAQLVGTGVACAAIALIWQQVAAARRRRSP